MCQTLQTFMTGEEVTRALSQSLFLELSHSMNQSGPISTSLHKSLRLFNATSHLYPSSRNDLLEHHNSTTRQNNAMSSIIQQQLRDPYPSYDVVCLVIYALSQSSSFPSSLEEIKSIRFIFSHVSFLLLEEDTRCFTMISLVVFLQKLHPLAF